MVHLERLSNRKSLLTKGILITAGVTGASSFLNGVKIEPAYGQEPTPTPVATDVITGQEPPVDSPILKIDPATNECIAIIFETKDEVIPVAGVAAAQAIPLEDAEPEQTLAPAEPIATENPLTGQAEPSLIPGTAVGEPSEYTKEEVELFAECEEGQEPVRNITVLVDEEPEATPEINIDTYTLDGLLSTKNKKITKEQFEKIIAINAPLINEYYVSKGYDVWTTEEEVKYALETLEDYLKRPDFSSAGIRFAGSIVGYMKQAEDAARNGHIDQAEALKNEAKAWRSVALKYIKFRKEDGNPSKELDKTIMDYYEGTNQQ